MDGAAQLGDRLLHVGPFRLHGGDLLEQNVELVVGLQVDAAEAFAVGLEALQGSVRFPERRQRIAAGDTGKRQALIGRRVERFADAPGFVLPPGPLRFRAWPRCGRGSRGRPTPALCASRRACTRGPERAVGCCQPAGSLVAEVSASASALSKSLTPVVETPGSALPALPHPAACLRDSLFERGDVLRGAFAARRPALAFRR